MSKTSLIVATPNSAGKAELIVQKLTEIGVGNIIFRNSERSQAKFDLRKKEERLRSIIKEATEQSWGRHSPVLSFVKTLDEVDGIEDCIVCDTLNNSEGKDFYASLDSYTNQHKICLVGPEGGWGSSDYAVFKKYNRCLMELGDRVLRMETAAIIAGWRVVNALS